MTEVHDHAGGRPVEDAGADGGPLEAHTPQAALFHTVAAHAEAAA